MFFSLGEAPPKLCAGLVYSWGMVWRGDDGDCCRGTFMDIGSSFTKGLSRTTSHTCGMFHVLDSESIICEDFYFTNNCF